MFVDNRVATDLQTATLGEIPGLFARKHNETSPTNSRLISTQLQKANAEMEQTFAVENEYREELSKTIVRLNHQLAEAILDEHYPRLDLHFLSWKVPTTIKPEQGVAEITINAPRFSVFTLDSPTTRLWADAQHSTMSDKWQVRPHTLQWLQEAYGLNEINKEIYKKYYFQVRNCTLTDHFKGRIPSEVKAKIRAADDKFDYIVLVCQANWEATANTFDPDPLVVGILSGKAWLIDAFDLTPVEAFIKDHFTTTTP